MSKTDNVLVNWEILETRMGEISDFLLSVYNAQNIKKELDAVMAKFNEYAQ